MTDSAPHPSSSQSPAVDPAQLAALVDAPPEAVVATAPETGRVLATDLSEARRLEQQVALNGRLAAVGELAAGVAHEVNNPLFAILALAELLAKDVPPGSQAAERLALIRSSGEEIKEIVRALLDFARENPEEPQAVALAQVARQAVALVRRTNADRSVELSPTYDDSDALVWGSPSRLMQIFLNLIANARQAMPSGGTVRIDVRRDGDHVVATVAGGDASGATFALRLPLAPEAGE